MKTFEDHNKVKIWRKDRAAQKEENDNNAKEECSEELCDNVLKFAVAFNKTSNKSQIPVE